MYFKLNALCLCQSLLVFQASWALCFAANASVQTAWGSHCTETMIPVKVQRKNSDIPLTNRYDVNVLYPLAGKEILASNSYNLSARICIPDPQRSLVPLSDTIQLLLHGATFSKIMWDLPYQPETYSWTKRMNEAGYPTIAVDLVGEHECKRPHSFGLPHYLRLDLTCNPLPD